MFRLNGGKKHKFFVALKKIRQELQLAHLLQPIDGTFFNFQIMYFCTPASESLQLDLYSESHEK
jgi:hypothetical protein